MMMMMVVVVVVITVIAAFCALTWMTVALQGRSSED